MKLSRVGVDLAKNVYQLHGVDRHGKTVWKRRLRRAPLSSLAAQGLQTARSGRLKLPYVGM